MTTLTPPQLGWMAGILDMKGRIRRTSSAYRKTPLRILYVESTRLDIVRRLCELTATKPEYSVKKIFESTDANRKACIEHCPEPHVHVTKSMPRIGRWHVTGVGAAIVLHSLIPYLVNDNGMWNLPHEIYGSITPKGQGRHAIDLAIKRLADAGWEIPPQVGKG